jgi:hypothetical protein
MQRFQAIDLSLQFNAGNNLLLKVADVLDIDIISRCFEETVTLCKAPLVLKDIVPNLTGQLTGFVCMLL